MRFAHFTTFLLALATGTHAANLRAVADDINQITDVSRQTDELAMKVVDGKTARVYGRQILDNFNNIITLVDKTLGDIGRPNSSVSRASQDCLSATDVQKCMRGLEKMSEGSGQGIGVEKRQNGDQNLVCEALETFVQVHIALLSTIIGKQGLLSRVPLVGPLIAGVLQTLENVVDTLAEDIIALIPDCADDVSPGIEALKKKLREAVNAYKPTA